MRSSSNTPYLERLDHLRFYAAALVVTFHFFRRHVEDLKPNNPLLSMIEEGNTGIGLFMVISGFIFTVISHNKEIDYWKFLRNRFIRIYPLFLFAVFLSLLISTYNEGRNYGFVELLGWVFPFRASTVSHSTYFIQLWTIWVEFQFYFIFPFLKQFYERHGMRYLLGWLALLIVLRGMIFLITGSVRFIAYETIFGRLDQFLIGMLAGLAYARRPGGFGHPLQLPAAGAAVLAAVHWFNLQGGHANMDGSFWIWWTTAEGLAWGWFVLAYLGFRHRLPGRMESWIAQLGTMSFSIYVMHNLVLAAVEKSVGVLPLHSDRIVAALLSAFLLALPAAVALAWATYTLIEKPFLAMRSSYLKSPRPPGPSPAP
jgi:peptidoglycan/LPS O-acetylase OafA/YrhL